MAILGRMEHEEMVGYSQYGELKGSGGGVKISPNIFLSKPSLLL